jgi:dTDP-3-amino-3,4,6-trideoxy-alpha-D-glucose transaminase
MTTVPFFDLGSFVSQYKRVILASFENVLDSGVFIGGREVEKFESAFAQSAGSSHCVAVGNGLDAIRILLEAHGIGPGDEVIVPGFTFYATWLAVLQTGATPVAVDVRIEDGTIDASKITHAISEKTKAILVVHLFGITVDMLTVNQIAKENDLLVFEDCAQAHAGVTNAGPVGSSCDGAAFSFYPTKNLGALGDAGAITTNDPVIAAKLRSSRSYGVGETKYEHISLGWNSRLDPLQASVLNVLLPGLQAVTDHRKQIARSYTEALPDGSTFLDQAMTGGDNVFHHFVLRVANRESARSQLGQLGISTDIHYPYTFKSLKPMVDCYSSLGLPLPELPNSSALAAEVLSLPMGPWMSEEQVAQVASGLTSFHG